MNRILIVILVAFSFQAYAQEKVVLEKPTIDKRVELLSIVFRLAERPEYSSKQFKLYSGKIERYFENYKNHELVQFAKSIVRKNHIGYDAVMTMAIRLDDNLKLLSDVNDVWQQDRRWSKKDAEKFASLLQKFYTETKFDVFFKDNADLYTETIKRYTPVYEKIDVNWFHSFYGKEPSETFLIILGLGNGTGNYGPSLEYINGNRKVYSMVGVSMVDSEGMPEFHPVSLRTLIHEFNHSFVNQLIEKNKDAFRKSGKKIFSDVKDVMKKQAYLRWQTMMYEALVRAAVIKYMKDHHDFDKQMIEYFTNWEKECGFIWIEELVAELESYDRQRDKYPTLESYMPKIIEAYKIWAENLF